jgi:hypothetical protein
MDCDNFRTTECPNPDPKILNDPTKNFCPKFSNGLKATKPQQPAPATEQATPQTNLPTTLPTDLPTETPAAYSICPKCGKRGSPQPKEIPNKNGDKTRTYWYYEHYNPAKSSKHRWCYIGKKKPEAGEKK